MLLRVVLEQKHLLNLMLMEAFYFFMMIIEDLTHIPME